MSIKGKIDALSGSALIVGCGYLGSRVATLAQASGCDVTVTTRSPARAGLLSEQGFDTAVVDWTDRRTLNSLPPFKYVLVAVSYDRRSPHSRYVSQVGGLKNLLTKISPQAHVCYISTTGVYHHTDGSWVDENTPARPTRDGGKAHLEAESLLMKTRPSSTNTILRLSGIYGPGRVPRASDVIAERPIQSPPDGFLNLIHVADAARAVMQSWADSHNGLYVVSDDQPIPRRVFYEEIARQCGAPEPRFESPPADAPVLMRSSSNKRIWNRRMKRDLVSCLWFPTYREGLRDVLRTIAGV